MIKHPLLLLLALTPVLAPAQTFNRIVDEVIDNNPSLAADRAAQRAETIARVAGNRLEATEVGFGYKWPTVAEEGVKWDFEVTQSFDWPGAYGARRRAARRAKAALDARLRVAERDLRVQTRTLLCKVIDANLRCDLLGSIVANLDSLHGAMHSMLMQRQITELDHRKVALEEVAMKQQLSDAESTRAATLASIAALNGGTLPAGVAELREYPDEQLKPLAEYLSAEVPEVTALSEDASTRVLDAKAERMGLYPGFSVGYAFESEGPARFHGFTLGLRLPGYSAKPKADAAEWEARALELQAEQAGRDRRAAITADHATAEITAGLLEEYRRAFGTDYPALLSRSLAGGQISYINYFSELNFYLSARLDYLTQLLSYHTILASLPTIYM